jgi:hypothetical protein
MTSERIADIGVQCSDIIEATETEPAKVVFKIDILLPDEAAREFMMKNKDNLAQVFHLILQETVFELQTREKNPEKAGIY